MTPDHAGNAAERELPDIDACIRYWEEHGKCSTYADPGKPPSDVLMAYEIRRLRAELERVKAENASALESVANLRRQFRVSRKDCRRLTAKAESFDAIWDVCVELGMKVNPPGVDGDGERIDEEWANQFAFLRDLRTRAESAEAALAEANAKLKRIEDGANADAADLETPRDGTKLTRHGLVQLIVYLQEEVASLRAELADAFDAIFAFVPERNDGNGKPLTIAGKIERLCGIAMGRQNVIDDLCNALGRIAHLCGTVNMSNERQKREAIEGSLDIAEAALQAKSGK